MLLVLLLLVSGGRRGPEGVGLEGSLRSEANRTRNRERKKRRALFREDMRKRLLCIIIILMMVAEVALMAPKDFNVGRAFAHCTKLTKSSYEIWITGVVSTLVGITGVRALRHVRKFFEYFEESANGSKTEDEISTELLKMIAAEEAARPKEAKETGDDDADEELVLEENDEKAIFSEANSLMYTIINTTIDGAKEVQLMTTATMKKYRNKGISLMKYIYDKHGPGSGPRQTAKKLKLQQEIQSEEENGEEFCDRLIQENSTLTRPVDGSMMCGIFIKGLKDSELQKYLLGEQMKDDINDLEDLKLKCDEYEVRSQILQHGVDGLFAGAARGGRGHFGRGRARGGRGQPSGRGGPNGTCNICGLPFHFWRNCRFINRAKRHPNTTAEQHAQMDRKRDELLRKLSPEFRRQVEEFMREQGNGGPIDARMAQPQHQQQAQLEFPNVDGRLAQITTHDRTCFSCKSDSPSKLASIVSPSIINNLWKVFLSLLAMLMTCSGVLLMLAIFAKIDGTTACATKPDTNLTDLSLDKVINIPSYAQLHQLPSKGVEGTTDALIASSLYRVSAGMPWDTCAGICMFNSTAPFYKWDENETRYKINGATASDYSKGSGRVLVGFVEDENDDIEWYDAPGILVPGLSESLLCPTWFALERGVYTTVNAQPYIMTCSGKCVPLSVENNVTRCKHLRFLSPGVEMPSQFVVRSPRETPEWATKDAYVQQQIHESFRNAPVDAQAAVLVDDRRNARTADEAKNSSFESWTKRLCGLSPEALSHLQANTVGGDCPADVPKKYKDLRWWSSAVAGKSRHSSHPNKSSETFSRFRECVAMDFLEFTVDGVKFHVHVFIDYYSTAAFGQVVKSRSAKQSGANLLWFLNKTEMYVTSAITAMRLKHDRAREYLAKYFGNVAVYSAVVQFPLVPYEHEMNGLVERFNQTLQRMVVVSMHDSNMPMTYAPYCVDFCFHVYNVVPVQGLDWKTRWEVMTGNKPDVRYIFRFGCLVRVLLPLELRKHKFDTYTEDCVYLGPCPLGKGTRFLRLKNMQVYVRDDCVVYGDILPFRSVGGKGAAVQIDSRSAANNDILMSVAWDDDEPSTSNSLQQRPSDAVQPANAQAPVSPTQTVVLRSTPGNAVSPQGMDTLGDVTPMSHGGGPMFEDVSPSVYVDFDPSSGGMSPINQNLNAQLNDTKSPIPALDPKHGTVSHDRTRGEWNSGHCENTDCTFPRGHTGLCSHEPSAVPFRGTRGARAGTAIQHALPSVAWQFHSLPPVAEEQPEGNDAMGIESEEQERSDESAVAELDALLATSTEIDGRMETASNDSMNVLSYVTTVDGLTATVDMDIVDGPVFKNTKKGTVNASRVFDMRLPLPKNLAEAKLSPNWDVPNGWKFAYEMEGSAFVKHRVMEDATVPGDVSPIDMGEVLTVKTDKHGRFKKAKLRFVVKCHKGVALQGEHYFDNFSQTVKWPNLRRTLDFACDRGFTIARCWDTSTAFLYQVLEPGTRVYVRLSNGLSEFCGMHTNFGRMLRNAYGLPSAPAGFELFRTTVLTGPRCKCTPCKHDEAVFVRFDGSSYIIICTWVDDFLVLSNSQSLYDEVYNGYFHDIDGEDGPLDFMLGVNFDVDSERSSIKIYSDKAINRIAERFGSPLRTSPVPGREDMAYLHDEPLPIVESPEWYSLRARAMRYRSLVPSMLYVGSTTRPDISYAIGVLCRCLDNPSEKHLEAADILLAYLLGTALLGVLYQRGASKGIRVIYSGLKNRGYAASDSNWATGKSTSGFGVWGITGLITWASKLQGVTALSSTEAEYYAASVCGVDVLAQRNFSKDLHDKDAGLMPTPLFVDNSACVSLGKHFASCKRVKHIDRRVHFLTDYQESGHIEIMPIATKDNTADIWTKPLVKNLFVKHRQCLVC